MMLEVWGNFVLYVGCVPADGMSDDAGSSRAPSRLAGQRAGAGLPDMAGAAPDLLIENLLQGARSEKVRAEFRAIPPSDYTEHSPLTLLVRVGHRSCRFPPPGHGCNVTVPLPL
jgi:hypothetical protein